MIEPHLLSAAGVVLAYGAFCGHAAWRWRRRQRAASPAAAAWLVVHASQSGRAEAIAAQTVALLRAGGQQAALAPIGQLQPAMLASAERLLMVASTTGEGDAPDAALPFLRGAMAGTSDLSALRFGLLALGDSDYRDFCAFGRRLDHWLRQQGATPLFAPIEMDREDDQALSQWQARIAALLPGATPVPRAAPEDSAWILAERRLLNPGDPENPAYHLGLTPEGVMPRWQAGDIASIQPCLPPARVAAWLARLDLSPQWRLPDGQHLTDVLATRRLTEDQAPLVGLPAEALAAALPPLPRRDYSIASLPEEGRLELLVRLARDAQGQPGLGSGWLTRHLAEGGRLRLALRPNPGFQAVAGRPAILLGAGTGLAGLRAHLKARRRAGERRTWLIFGERFSAHSHFHRHEMAGWQAEGFLDRLDLAFSRDGGAPRYVQDALAAEAPRLRAWLAEGAVIYVCGSRAGLGAGVQAVLQDLLGEASLAALAAEGRYRRDVY
ncbi:flavodoxin domain-containing protein [Roseomonas sp. 18066]|uniref:flavodoxin domain-containing protein n=1 Tax=Roseomonas sp. 18066 TaxID=2681412 RepID=UPI00135CCF7E|nr:flavodoxin domain-containing protein [Roseomonas sp. 18066]